MVSIASLALDVGSYAVSGKTMTDHGISLVADEDCALIRVFEGQLCQDYQHYENVTVATLQPLPSGEPAILYAELPVRHEDDPLAALPLGYDEALLAVYHGNGSFARTPILEDEASDGSPLSVQFAGVPADLLLSRDTR